MPVFVVDKPLGLTSHDVVARARKRLKTKRVGHAGTLDPLATGVLVILTEDSTKLSPFLTASKKRYLAWVSFGASTPTLDAEGPLTEVRDASHLSQEAILEALPPFLKVTEQLPPQFSAVKKAGVKGYEAARKGEALELAPRPAGYEQIDLLAFAPSRDDLPQSLDLSKEAHDWRPHPRGVSFELPPPLGDFPTALFSLTVRAGTYIRAFARDLGGALGLPAHLSGLVRTKSGGSGLEEAVALDDLAHVKGLSNAEALPYPLVTISDEEEIRALQGKGLMLELDGPTGLVAADGHLVAIASPAAPGRAKVMRAWRR